MDTVAPNCSNVTEAEAENLAAAHVVKIVALILINLAVVLGNSLVIIAVVTTRKLRTVTNIFIVSLACADLLLGVAVLPFSISLEVVDIWLWGEIWCSMWLAIDVLLCTASILSLCAISMDRYIAVTHPIRYPTIMSAPRGRVLVAGVWVSSFVICLPPLIGWNDASQTSEASTDINELLSSSHNSSLSNYTDSDEYLRGTTKQYIVNVTDFEFFDGFLSNISALFNTSDNCVQEEEYLTCELTSTKGYRIYASMGSFFIPMLVMTFFYLRIYLTAWQTAASIRRGVLTMRTSNDIAQSQGYGEEEMHLRVHRGGSNSLGRYSSGKNYDWHRASTRKAPNNDTTQRSPRPEQQQSPVNAANTRETNGRAHLILKDNTSNGKPDNGVTWHSNIFRPVTQKLRKSLKSKRKQSEDVTEMQVITATNNGNNVTKTIKEVELNSDDNPGWSPGRSMKKSPRRCKLLIRENKGASIKGHARKFKREAKAAKTLAIIVGAFIICWFPFFTIYLVGAFCQSCVSDIVFSVFFWLGYCNSALNPCIYALFARDFRSAFTRLLFCQRRKRFTHAARADYVTGTRSRLTPPAHENDSASDY